MKQKISGWIDLLAAPVNYIIICFVLSHMKIRFQHDLVFILFSASQIWVTGAFWGKVQKTADNRLFPAILTAACFLIHAGPGLYDLGHPCDTVKIRLSSHRIIV